MCFLFGTKEEEVHLLDSLKFENSERLFLVGKNTIKWSKTKTFFFVKLSAHFLQQLVGKKLPTFYSLISTHNHQSDQNLAKS